MSMLRMGRSRHPASRDTCASMRIAMWSGPRNISTAMMRAFENRSDCTVSDEPLYAAFLKQTGLDHPGAAEVIADGECDWQRVTETLTGPVPGGKPLWYQKHMSHHLLPGMDREWIHGLSNALPIRAATCKPCAIISVLPSKTACCTGRPGRVKATASGPSIGMTRSGARPGSRHGRNGFPNSALAIRPSPTSACPPTNAYMRHG
jgi:hypothetical protein